MSGLPLRPLSIVVALVAVFTFATAAVFAASPQASSGPPNVIFILTDDLGWGDLGCYGHPYIHTPNLNRLAKEGTLFTQFYVANPVCSPSRTAFTTGHYPARHRVHQHFSGAKENAARGMPNWLDAGVTTLPDLLKQKGYATAHFGKWHLGNGPGAPSPAEYGFDVHRTVNSSGPGWEEEKSDPFFRAHSTDLIVDEALRFIDAHQNQPFYINAWTLVPHALLKPTAEELAVYKELTVDLKQFKGYMQKYAGEAPDLASQARVFFAAVTGLDKALGRLFDGLAQRGLTDKTLVFFSSDNGPEDYHIGNARNAGMGSPGPFRGRKRSLYEGGIRTSCLVRWPGHVPAGRVDNDSVIAAVDFLPSVCQLAAATAPAAGLDGEDASDILLGQPRPRRRPLFWEWRGNVSGDPVYRPPALAIRDGNWKLYLQPDASGAELYDLLADPGQTKNLAQQYPQQVKSLGSKLLAWKKTLPE